VSVFEVMTCHGDHGEWLLRSDVYSSGCHFDCLLWPI